MANQVKHQEFVKIDATFPLEYLGRGAFNEEGCPKRGLFTLSLYLNWEHPPFSINYLGYRYVLRSIFTCPHSNILRCPLVSMTLMRTASGTSRR